MFSSPEDIHKLYILIWKEHVRSIDKGLILMYILDVAKKPEDLPMGLRT